MSKLVLEQNKLLPQNWTVSDIQEILFKLESGSRPKGGVKKYKKGIVSIGGEHITNTNGFQFDTIKFIPNEFYELMNTGHIQKNDILIVKDGATTGRTSFVSTFFPYTKSAVNEHVFILRTFENCILPKFLFYFFLSPFGQQTIKSRITGSAQGGINTSFVKNFPILIPPLNEQKRIVEKIEELFSLIDSNSKTLLALQNKIKIFKESLLHNAFNGNLTKDWRDSFTHLKRSQDVIQDFKQINKNFIEIPKENIKFLPKIPSEWSWVYLSNLGELSRGKSKHRPRNDPKLFGGKYPFIQTGIVRNSKRKIVNYEQTYNEIGLDQSRLFPAGTLCITIAANIAETAILTFPSCFPDSIVGFIGYDKIIHTWFVMYYIKSYQEKLESIAPATAQKNINLNILQKVAIPLMSYDEQNKIVNELETGFSLADNFSRFLETQIKIHTILKNSILKQAFEGKLVPQDPNDEPAEILLQKIKQEKEQLLQKQKASKRKKNVK